jgi:hypothetical protein
VVLAVVPWLAVVGLVMAGWRLSQRVPATSEPRTESMIRPQTVVAHLPHSAKHPTTLDSRTQRGSPEALHPVLGTTAAAAVQQMLTGTDPASNRSRYVNLALPQTATWVGDVVIVDVAAIVLEGTGGRWDRPHPVRYAVPLRVRAGTVRVLSAPWTLPDPPQTAPEDTAFAPIEDWTLTEATGRALRTVGYQDVHVQALARDPGLPGVLKAKVTAISPGEGQPRSQELWVSDQPSPTVLGADHSGVRLGVQMQPTMVPANAAQGGAR